MASVKLVLRTTQESQTGHCPLYIRLIKRPKSKISHNRSEIKAFRMGRSKSKSKENHPNSARLNAYLSKLLQMQKVRSLMFGKNETVSAKKLKKKQSKGKNLHCFLIMPLKIRKKSMVPFPF